MNGRGERVSAGLWVSRVHGRVCPDLGLAGLARIASTLSRDLLLNLALGWCCCADGRKGGYSRESGVSVTTGSIAPGSPPQTATKVDNAIDQSLGQPPWPNLRVLGVVPRDVDVLVPAGAA